MSSSSFTGLAPATSWCSTTRRAQDRVDGVRQAIAAAGASLLYLPPYSPDVNPIEQFFAKLKALLRRAAARTKDALWATIGHLLEIVPESDAPTTAATAAIELRNMKML